MIIFDLNYPKFPEVVSTFYSIHSFLRYSQFQIPVTIVGTPILIMPTLIFLDQSLISINLYQYEKTQVFSSFFSSEIVDLKILESDWPRAFCLISLESNFPSIRVGKIQHMTETFIIGQIKKNPSKNLIFGPLLTPLY